MKKRSLRTSSIVLVLCALFLIPASATARASDQISSYNIDVKPDRGGLIKTTFKVSGVGAMAELGAKSITYYEKNSNSWLLVGYTDLDSAGMTATDTNYYFGYDVFYGTAGTEYKVVATIFAKDYSGMADYRTQTFYVTA